MVPWASHLASVIFLASVGKELLAGIDANDVQAQHLVVVHDLLELVLTQHAVVDEDAGEVRADGFVQQHGGNGAVDTARESEDDAVVAQLKAQRGDGAFYERGSAPLLTRAADVDDEILQQLLTLQGVIYLGMELHGENTLAISFWLIAFGIRRILDILGGGDAVESVGDGGDGVTMRHPHLRVLVEALEERVRSVDGLEVCTAIFARVGLFHTAAQRMADELCTIADAEHGDATCELREVHLESLRIVHRVG